ncbi:hypothetical protein BD410DRAFT_804217 [Rickenella mellea]|uniref:Uncharacterized protein n=1 Tax=Rickenella mellea TaxID=50990 RepID=A0A4Y7Q1P3_9AGAM|nr:hypothetical protein BD410DRAFT_804217 [Rickenella mellea]
MAPQPPLGLPGVRKSERLKTKTPKADVALMPMQERPEEVKKSNLKQNSRTKLDTKVEQVESDTKAMATQHSAPRKTVHFPSDVKLVDGKSAAGNPSGPIAPRSVAAPPARSSDSENHASNTRMKEKGSVASVTGKLCRDLSPVLTVQSDSSDLEVATSISLPSDEETDSFFRSAASSGDSRWQVSSGEFEFEDFTNELNNVKDNEEDSDYHPVNYDDRSDTLSATDTVDIAPLSDIAPKKRGRPRKAEIAVSQSITTATTQTKQNNKKAIVPAAHDRQWSDYKFSNSQIQFVGSRTIEFKLSLREGKIPGECNAWDWNEAYSDIIQVILANCPAQLATHHQPRFAFTRADEKPPGDLITSQLQWSRLVEKIHSREREISEYKGNKRSQPKPLTPLVVTIFNPQGSTSGTSSTKGAKKPPLGRMVYPNQGSKPMDSIDCEPYALAKGQHNESSFAPAQMLDTKYRSIEEAKVLISKFHRCMKHNGRLCYILKPSESKAYAGNHIEIGITLSSSYAKAVTLLQVYDENTPAPKYILDEILLLASRSANLNLKKPGSKGRSTSETVLSNEEPSANPPRATILGTNPTLTLPLHTYPTIADVLIAVAEKDSSHNYLQFGDALCGSGAETVGQLLFMLDEIKRDGGTLAGAIVDVVKGVEGAPVLTTFAASMLSSHLRKAAVEFEAGTTH